MQNLAESEGAAAQGANRRARGGAGEGSEVRLSSAGLSKPFWDPMLVGKVDQGSKLFGGWGPLQKWSESNH